VQDEPWRWHTPDKKEAFLLCFEPRFTEDTTVIQLALNSPGDVAKAWEASRSRLEGMLGPEALDGIWGYTLTYQARLNPGIGADETFKELRRAVYRLHSDRREQYARLADADVAGGHMWLMAVPIDANGPAAGTVYVALSEPERESEREQEGALVKIFFGPDAKLLMPDLIAHKGYYQRRLYRDETLKAYRRYLRDFRRVIRESLKNDDQQRQIETRKLNKLTRRYDKLVGIVWQFEDLRVSMARQLRNYDEWPITENNNVLKFHRSYIDTTNSELELLVSEGKYSLGVASPVLSVARLRAEKAREEDQQQLRDEEERRWRQQQDEQRSREEEQTRRQRRTATMVSVVGAAIAIPQLINQKMTVALLEEVPPAPWLLGLLLHTHKLNLDKNNTHLLFVLGAQIILIAVAAIVFYVFIRWLSGGPRDRASDHK
jgi:hypothetical protein